MRSRPGGSRSPQHSEARSLELVLRHERLHVVQEIIGQRDPLVLTDLVSSDQPAGDQDLTLRPIQLIQATADLGQALARVTDHEEPTFLQHGDVEGRNEAVEHVAGIGAQGLMDRLHGQIPGSVLFDHQVLRGAARAQLPGRGYIQLIRHGEHALGVLGRVVDDQAVAQVTQVVNVLGPVAATLFHVEGATDEPRQLLVQRLRLDELDRVVVQRELVDRDHRYVDLFPGVLGREGEDAQHHQHHHRGFPSSVDGLRVAGTRGVSPPGVSRTSRTGPETSST